jgi:dihydrofolate reductase
MSEIIYHIATTVDGLIADRNGDCPPSFFLYEGDHIQAFLDQVKQYDMVLMGGKTYEYGFKFGLKPGEPGYRGLKHIVFSRSMDFESNSDVELVKDDAVAYTRALRDLPGKKIWLCGGGQLASALLEQELLDTLILKINPAIGGEGLSLFAGSRKNVQLALRELVRYQSGVLLATYNIKY